MSGERSARRRDRLNTGEKLPGRIKSTLVEDGLVKAFAADGDAVDKHVSLGLALIRFQTRDEALFRIVEGEQLPLGRRWRPATTPPSAAPRREAASARAR